MPHSPPPDTKPPLEPEHKSKNRRALTVIILIAVLVAGGGILMRLYEGSELSRETKYDAITPVVVIKASQGPANEEIALPGNVQAWHEAPIYARTSGYLKSWVTDIGAHVKTGDLMAEIETPEIDAQMHQAEADLATAEANNGLAKSTAVRWQALLKVNAVSKQESDEKNSDAAAKEALVASARANLNRLQELEAFKRVTAPFDGTITARNTDTGALINAGSSGTGLELFHIAETDKLRVYVQVPETYTRSITPELAAELHFASHAGETFPAKLARTADALDPATRTQLIELEVDNEKRELLPGGYAEVHIKLPSSADMVRLPVNTILFRAEGLRVAIIDKGHARLKPISTGRDYGNEIEVTSGIAPGETIIVNPPDSLADGQAVRVVTSGQDQQGTGDKGDKAERAKDKNDGDDKKP